MNIGDRVRVVSYPTDDYDQNYFLGRVGEVIHTMESSSYPYRVWFPREGAVPITEAFSYDELEVVE